MVEKIGKQENLPENMGIIPILKMKKVIFFFVFFYSLTLNHISNIILLTLAAGLFQEHFVLICHTSNKRDSNFLLNIISNVTHCQCMKNWISAFENEFPEIVF